MADLDTDDTDFDGLDDTDGTDVSLTELLEQTIVGTLQAQAGPVIGKVDTYDAAAGRVAVTPLVPLLVAGEIVAAPKLPSVPVSWLGSASHSIRWPIGPGSLVSLEPLGHDHSQWMVSGSPNIPPTDDRRFSIADLVAKPLAPSPTADPPDPLSYDALWGVFFDKWIVGGTTAPELVALANLVKANFDTIQIAYDAHDHPTAPTGPVSVPSKLILTLPDVACTKLKAE